jgi:hypothetical protein
MRHPASSRSPMLLPIVCFDGWWLIVQGRDRRVLEAMTI